MSNTNFPYSSPPAPTFPYLLLNFDSPMSVNNQTYEEDSRHFFFSDAPFSSLLQYIPPATFNLTNRLLKSGILVGTLLKPIPYIIPLQVPRKRPSGDGENEIQTPARTKLQASKRKKYSSNTRNGGFETRGEHEDCGASIVQTNSLIRSCGLRGERRLIIEFQSFGEVGVKPQTFGKSSVMIPNGLKGRHRFYDEAWKFEIVHTKTSFHKNGLDCVCIMWRIINLSTETKTEHLENEDEAFLRMKRGWTCSSRLFREAIEIRAKQLENLLSKCSHDDTLRINCYKTKIESLRPKNFSEGTLIFGLQHSIVQQKLLAAQSNTEDEGLS